MPSFAIPALDGISFERFSICTAARLHGCTAARLHGCTAARLHGMLASTLRRHLAALIKAGLITRRDSPNGRRYTRRNRDGQIVRAFGFCLTPLMMQAAEISAASEDAHAEAMEIRGLREEISVSLRDVARLLGLVSQRQDQSDCAADLAGPQHCIRRKLPLTALQDLHLPSRVVLQELVALLPVEAEEVSASDSQYERHYQKSKQEDSESEGSEKIAAETAMRPEPRRFCRRLQLLSRMKPS